MQIYLAHDGQTVGPFSAEDVKAEVAKGTVTLEQLAWYEGAAGWVPLASVPGFAGGAAPAPKGGGGKVFQHSSYLVRRKVFQFVGASFHIHNPDGQVAFYSKQKAFKLKEDIRVYTGEDMATEVLVIQARKILDFSSAYDVVDPTTKEKVGALKRKGIKSLMRDEWVFMDASDREIGTIREDSLFLALLRRFLGLLACLLFPQKYHGTVGEKPVCVFKQNFNPFVMKIALDYSMDTEGLLDRRLGIAGAILLCAIEGKQEG